MPIWGGGSGSGSGGGLNLLGVKRYAPAVDANTYTLAATMTELDTTNLRVTFTAPTSGNIIVVYTGLLLYSLNDDVRWQVFEGGAGIGISHRMSDHDGANHGMRLTMREYMTGVTGGSHTYGWGAIGSTSSFMQGGPTWGPFLMEVWG